MKLMHRTTAHIHSNHYRPESSQKAPSTQRCGLNVVELLRSLYQDALIIHSKTSIQVQQNHYRNQPVV